MGDTEPHGQEGPGAGEEDTGGLTQRRKQGISCGFKSRSRPCKPHGWQVVRPRLAPLRNSLLSQPARCGVFLRLQKRLFLPEGRWKRRPPPLPTPAISASAQKVELEMDHRPPPQGRPFRGVCGGWGTRMRFLGGKTLTVHFVFNLGLIPLMRDPSLSLKNTSQSPSF